MVCENDAKCLSLLKDPSPCLKVLVYLKPVLPTTVELANQKGIKLISFEQVEKLGAGKAFKEMVSGDLQQTFPKHLFLSLLTCCLLNTRCRLGFLFCSAADARRLVHSMLHVRHHGSPERCHADPREHRGRRERHPAAARRPEAEQQRRHDVVSAASAHVGAHLRDCRLHERRLRRLL